MFGSPFVETDRKGVYISHVKLIDLPTLYGLYLKLISQSLNPIDISVHPHTKDMITIEVMVY